MAILASSLSGWVDFDRDSLPLLDGAEKINYFEKRAQMVSLRPLKRLADTVLGYKDESSVLIFGLSICCSIEATGRFFNGGTSENWANFQDFVGNYMDRGFARKMDGYEYSRILWEEFRNGLAHGFTVKRGGFEAITEYFYIKNEHGQNSLMIDPQKLYADFEKGFCTYLKHLRAATPEKAIWRRFETVFHEVFIEGR